MERNTTTKRFVRSARWPPGLMLEVAFDSVHRSTRHKSGLAMRFPRVHRIRWDKPWARRIRWSDWWWSRGYLRVLTFHLRKLKYFKKIITAQLHRSEMNNELLF